MRLTTVLPSKRKDATPDEHFGKSSATSGRLSYGTVLAVSVPEAVRGVDLVAVTMRHVE